MTLPQLTNYIFTEIYTAATYLKVTIILRVLMFYIFADLHKNTKFNTRKKMYTANKPS